MAIASFDEALEAVLGFEGGYVNHPFDPGGATKFGITRAALKRARGRDVAIAEVMALTRHEAAVIYREHYWHAVRADELPAGIDLAVFDTAVNSGPARAVRLLQQAAGVTVDGRIGPVTLAAVEAQVPHLLIERYCAARLGFLERLRHFHVFGRGWRRRVERVEERAKRLATQADVGPGTIPSHPARKGSDMSDTKSIFTSRTVWANAVGMAAILLSLFGVETDGVDTGALTDALLQIVAGVSFVASTVFRVMATNRLER
ncbi:glycoside hydrolase family 108 protein [Chelatococcus daeguensis]|uniref:Lysozyme family protein n=1 Tax=Chelatococcus daeguensis TaxID=444444 RepID=A0AAC9NYE1_9HYPH|nr:MULTISPECIES: glycosyl hydrolase 108 family protein [Chelatococcus]APF37043.1 hypothetical protein BOQ54_06620 [Chelatococcus daeguensis]KZE32576.1 hypothetical protein AVW15_02180 [Chelatococcus daeguensis]MBM3084825.1 glycoside hydrolase family 108 protein [Chelatococcus daeguensis]